MGDGDEKVDKQAEAAVYVAAAAAGTTQLNLMEAHPQLDGRC